MSLITILIAIIVVCLVLWLVNTYLPITPPFKQVLNILVILAVIIWILAGTGVGNIRIGR